MAAQVEVVLASRRVYPEAAPAARHPVDSVNIIPLGAEVVDQTPALPADGLPSPDAVHLASPVKVRAALDWLVT